MSKVYTVGLDGTGLDELISAIENYPKWLESRIPILLNRLTDEGVQIARTGFERAAYDGTNDVSVGFENRGEHTRAVVAVGATVLFIEFGTGITYPDTHPEAAANGMTRGGYGKGKGNQPTWGYYGDPGTNGVVSKETERGTLVLTHGNPANMPMYEASKQLRERFTAIVREVFQ